MKEKGSNIGLFLNVWSILAIISTIISTISAIMLLSEMFYNEILSDGVDMILNFMDDYINIEIISIALVF
jgi:hypothetical protein